ncbi:MAG: site-specific DNA-methyltransferase [Actinomycetota bacterium]|nr:site-specific DNA-methyltransferase [Actinomycetota bacterium]
MLSDDATVLVPEPVREPFVTGDARDMSTVADGSVALVVTSPPYFAGKQYEVELERDGIPASYLEYLQLLRDVFGECVRTLEPGGRIAVNVANLGRRPYRSLSADVIRILGDDLGLLLRGELIWQKAEGASGSCAWGSFRQAANPVLRDISERVVIASKGRFDRALDPRRRAAAGLPHRSTVSTDDFMALTLDVWSIPPEQARRVGHPAPFPVELPEQLIRLYTFEDDLVLDPFMGSGSALVAAAKLGRRYVGYDLDPDYVALARTRVDAVLATPPRLIEERPPEDGSGTPRRAEQAVTAAGFTITGRKRRVPGTAVTVALTATDAAGAPWYFEVAGAGTEHRPGLTRPDVVWRTLGRLAALRGGTGGSIPIVVLTPRLPRRRSEGDTAIRAAGRDACFDIVELGSPSGAARLARYAASGAVVEPLPGFW